MAKVTLSGVALALVNAAGSDGIHLDDIHKAVLAAGLNVLPQQTYAGVQSMASTRKIARHATKARTFIKLEEGLFDGPKLTKSVVTTTGRTRINRNAVPNQTILDAITADLGPAVERPSDEFAYVFVLLGDYGYEDMKPKAAKGLKSEPTRWFTYEQAGSTIVGLLP